MPAHKAQPPDRAAGERAKYWQTPILPGSELLFAHYRTQNFAPHTHEHYVIGAVAKGAYRYDYRHREHIAGAGSVPCCYPGEVHNGQAVNADGWTYRMFYIDTGHMCALTTQIADRPAGLPFFPDSVIHDPDIAARLLAIHAALEQGASPLEAETRLLSTLALLITRHADPRVELRPAGDERDVVALARDYIEDNYTRNITLDELGRLVCMSNFHFVRVFHEVIGMPPHAYLNHVRIRRARQLLAAGQPIARVSFDTGFADQSHLTRHFRRIVGVTPGRYRQSISKNVQD
ncbi:MAG: AraC family transcriptional regulator [Anaerolineae bacterium]|nr:AraC family transcriptional regulator [Anaerolineae bacterium]